MPVSVRRWNVADDVMRALVADLVAEQQAVDRVVADLLQAQWDTASPAEGWTLRDCIVHLADVDELAGTILATGAMPQRTRDDGAGVLTAVQLAARTKPVSDVLAWWRSGRDRLAAAALAADPKARLPWVGPPMSARSFVTARLMEAWSHGLDIHDAADVPPTDTDRLRHIAHLGVVTREFAYRNRGLEPPATPLYVELVAPSGDTWTWGPADAPDRITGPAGDFCRAVTQRIHPLDTALKTEGPLAAEYLTVAQAFAGPPGQGRPPKGQA